MSGERSRIIGFDGIHRSGKGTQIDRLETRFRENDIASLTVRGDGTRDGKGDTSGDPPSAYWQERSNYLRSKDAKPDDWHASAYDIVHELHDHATSGQHEAILADRSLISRAAFMLYSGANPGRKGFDLEELYPVREHVPRNKRIDLRQVLPDILFHLEADGPEVVMSRLDPNDPKYDFRARNIQITFEGYRRAARVLPPEVRDRVHTIDAALEEEVVHERIVRALGDQAIINLDS